MAEYYKIETTRNMYGQISCRVVPCDEPSSSMQKKDVNCRNPFAAAWNKIKQKAI